VKLTFIMDGNFSECNGRVISPHMHYEAFAGRFARSFDAIEIVGRAFPASQARGLAVEGNGVRFTRLPNYRGAIGLLRSIPAIFRSLRKAVSQAEVIVLRFPGNIAIVALLICLTSRRRFTVEVVADPVEYFRKGASNHPLRTVSRFVHKFFTKYAAKNAEVVRYVTHKYLQEKYPPGRAEVAFGFTDVYLPVKSCGLEQKIARDVPLLINVAMMHNSSKGHADLMQAVALLKREGVICRLQLIGDGRLRPELEKLAEALSISELVVFSGVVAPSEKVWRELGNADLFVLPSYQEGMPRSLLEALMLGIPALTSDVGGIPEVMVANLMLEAGNVSEIAAKIKYALSPNSRSLHEECFGHASYYCIDHVENEFPRYIAKLKENWPSTVQVRP